MGKKKEPTLQDGLKVFKEVMARASLSDYTYVNRTLLSKNQKGRTILIVPEEGLWNLILDDADLKGQLKPLDLNDPASSSLKPLFEFGEDLADTSWLPIDHEALMGGQVIKISIDSFEYSPVISGACLPVKLRKAEFNDITYRVFTSPSYILALKKYFSSPVEGGGFTMMRLFKIL